MIELVAALFAFGTVLGVVWFSYQRFYLRSHLQTLLPGDIISTDDFAIIERDISNLRKVIIVCDVMEEPSNLLYDSIKDNLSEGVEYHFFVSDAKFEYSCADPLRFFENAERLVKNLKADDVTRLTKVHAIGHDRNNRPYVFLVTDDAEGASMVCLKGMEVGVGIANEYLFVDPDDAKNLYDLLVKSYPKLLKAQARTAFVKELSEDIVPTRGSRPITPPLRVVGD